MKRIHRELILELKSLNTKLEDVLINQCAQELEKYFTEIGEVLYTDINGLSNNILDSTKLFKTIDDFDDEGKLEKIEEHILAFNEAQEDILEKINGDEVVETSFNMVNSKIETYLKEMHFLVFTAMANNEQKLASQLKGMIRAVFSKICTFLNMVKIESLKEYIAWSKAVTDTVSDEVNRVKALYEEKLIREESSYIEDENKIEFSKIYEAKKLNKLLLEQGYESIRQNGSHKIFHKDGFSIPVPQHSKDLGKGLSIAIQKQALQNC